MMSRNPHSSKFSRKGSEALEAIEKSERESSFERLLQKESGKKNNEM
jgi:hypothetical protein